MDKMAVGQTFLWAFRFRIHCSAPYSPVTILKWHRSNFSSTDL